MIVLFLGLLIADRTNVTSTVFFFLLEFWARFLSIMCCDARGL